MVEQLGRNDPCHCGSGKKYKKCCMAEDDQARSLELKNINSENIANSQLDISEVLPQFDPSTNSAEYNALEDWVDEYLKTIDDDHPFRRYLLNSDLTHSTLIKIARENGWSDYYEKAEKLYKKYESS